LGRIPAYGGVGLSGVPLRSIPFGNATRPSNPLRSRHFQALRAGSAVGWYLEFAISKPTACRKLRKPAAGWLSRIDRGGSYF
jgi:hypothetical protein